jgi:hypothetical protein
LFVVEHFTANAVSVAIGDNGNRLILKYGGISSTTSFLLRMLFSLHANYLKDLRDFGLDKGGADCLVLYVTWRPFVFLSQFDLNLFMTTTENSSIIRMLNFFKTMATFSSWNSIKKAHHVDFVASRT